MIAALRGAADGLEALLGQQAAAQGSATKDRFGLLCGVARTNLTERRGATEADMRQIATANGYDVRGVAGEFAAGTLAWNAEHSRTKLAGKGPGRWVTDAGFAWLREHGWKPPKNS